jgi:hypothetical protein
MSDRKNHVPAWYRVEEVLISNRLTRPLLFNWLRVKKKYGTIRERRLARKYPQCLMNFERKVSSQNGEDGIIREIFNRIGTTDKFFVEFGIQDGRECCTRDLVENQGWSGLWLEGSPEDAERARQNFARFPIKVLQRFVTAENIVAALEEAGIPREFDFLSIDVDGNDYWIWKAVVARYSPRAMVIEYNSTFGSRQPWVVPHDPNFLNDGTAFFGASLESFARLGKEFGYHLVGCDSNGINAFFVRSDLVGTKFIGLDQPASFHYVAPHYDAWFGHPVRIVEPGGASSPAQAGHLKPDEKRKDAEKVHP